MSTIREIEKHVALLRVKEGHKLDKVNSFVESVEGKAIQGTVELLRSRNPIIVGDDRKSLERMLHRLEYKYKFLKAAHRSAKETTLDYEVYLMKRRERDEREANRL